MTIYKLRNLIQLYWVMDFLNNVTKDGKGLLGKWDAVCYQL